MFLIDEIRIHYCNAEIFGNDYQTCDSDKDHSFGLAGLVNFHQICGRNNQDIQVPNFFDDWLIKDDLACLAFGFFCTDEGQDTDIFRIFWMLLAEEYSGQVRVNR